VLAQQLPELANELATYRRRGAAPLPEELRGPVDRCTDLIRAVAAQAGQPASGDRRTDVQVAVRRQVRNAEAP
jgi:hypothetical protein